MERCRALRRLRARPASTGAKRSPASADAVENFPDLVDKPRLHVDLDRDGLRDGVGVVALNGA